MLRSCAGRAPGSLLPVLSTIPLRADGSEVGRGFLLPHRITLPSRTGAGYGRFGSVLTKTRPAKPGGRWRGPNRAGPARDCSPRLQPRAVTVPVAPNGPTATIQ